MPYSLALSPPSSQDTRFDTLGHRVHPVTPSDTLDQVDPVTGTYFKYFMALTDGNAAVLGYKNGDADTPVVLAVSAGQVIEGRIRRIRSTGTTATFCGWAD